MKVIDEEKLIKQFNKQTRVMEWVGGCTYYIGTYRTLKSSCLDELFQMFRAKELGLEIPKRTKFFHK